MSATLKYSDRRPDSGGYWLWKEGGNREPVRLLLCEGGVEVASVDEAEDGTPQYYWEQTETTQEQMPGLWAKEATPAEGKAAL